MTRIVTPQPIFQKTPNLRGTPLERRYYKWLHENCACCLTMQPEFDICHTGGLTEGKGMGRKAAIKTCLPLIRKLHLTEEAGRERFWEAVGIPDYLAWAERLFDLFETDQSPEDLLMDMHERANLIEVARMMR